MTLGLRTTVHVLGLTALAAGCGDNGGDPIDVVYGETTIVVVLNPSINDATEDQVPLPGIERDDVAIVLDDGSSAVTDRFGIAVLAPVEPGMRTATISGDGIAGSVEIEIEAGELREVAIAADGSDVALMSDVGFGFGGGVVEVDPSMSTVEVNDALGNSNAIIFLRGGVYEGELDFAGSNAVLFGEGALGGVVVLDGNVLVSGSSSRIRGAIVTGDLELPASDASVSFSRIEGAMSIEGSDATLLFDDVCGPVTLDGSGLVALDTNGLAPLAPPEDCP